MANQTSPASVEAERLKRRQAFIDWWQISHQDELARATQAVLRGKSVHLHFDAKAGRVVVSILEQDTMRP